MEEDRLDRMGRNPIVQEMHKISELGREAEAQERRDKFEAYAGILAAVALYLVVMMGINYEEASPMELFWRGAFTIAISIAAFLFWRRSWR